MLRLRDIMTTDVLTVSPDTCLREAMELLARRHVSGAPVVRGGKLLGVVSATDLMAFAAALPGVPTDRGVYGEKGESRSSSLDREVDRAVEQEDEPGSAFFSEMWEDADVDVTTRIGNVEGPEWNALEEYDVSDVMTSTPLTTLPPDADAESAASLMKQYGIHRVLVTEGEKLVGIVSALDIVRVVADHKLVTRTYAFNHDREFDNRVAGGAV